MVEETLTHRTGEAVGEEIRAVLRIPYGLRRVPVDAFARLLPLQDAWSTGDIVVARVETVGKNTTIELAGGRKSLLHPGDLIAGVFGNRYATRQFEGYARAEGDSCHLLSVGGVCGMVESRHDLVAEPTRLKLLGRAADANGRALSLGDFACGSPSYVVGPRVIVVCGTSMDSGKSHTVRSVIKSLRKEGHAVAGIKVTGTATGSDTWGMLDAGARPTLDFVDAGYPSTYLLGDEKVVELHEKLLANAAEADVKWVVIEVADGLLQRETAALIRSARFTGTVDAWVFASGDPLGAVGGISMLEDLGIHPLAVSGVVARSALARREVEQGTGLPCLTPAEIESPRFLELLSERVGA